MSMQELYELNVESLEGVERRLLTVGRSPLMWIGYNGEWGNLHGGLER